MLLFSHAHPPPAALHVLERRLAGEHDVTDSPLWPRSEQPVRRRVQQRRSRLVVHVVGQRLVGRRRPNHRRRTEEAGDPLREEVEEQPLRDLVHGSGRNFTVLEQSREKAVRVFILALRLLVGAFLVLFLVAAAWRRRLCCFAVVIVFAWEMRVVNGFSSGVRRGGGEPRFQIGGLRRRTVIEPSDLVLRLLRLLPCTKYSCMRSKLNISKLIYVLLLVLNRLHEEIYYCSIRHTCCLFNTGDAITYAAQLKLT